MTSPASQIKPLSDPASYYVRLGLPATCLNAFWLLFQYDRKYLTFSLIIWLTIALLYVLDIIPRRRFTAIYLRSFDIDKINTDIRDDIRRRTKSKLKISGVRSLTDRVTVGLWDRDPLVTLVISVFKGPFSLEAGSDWPVRLWRTLADMRAVFIDMSKISESVLLELRLSYKCVGPHRLCVIVPGQTPIDAWYMFFARELNIDIEAARALHILPIQATKNMLSADSYPALSNFTNQLPLFGPGLNYDAFKSVQGFVRSDSETLLFEKFARLEVQIRWIILFVIPAILIILVKLLNIPWPSE